MIVSTKDNSNPDEKIENKEGNYLSNDTISYFFDFQETMFAKKIEEYNLEDKQGILEALVKVATLEKKTKRNRWK